VADLKFGDYVRQEADILQKATAWGHDLASEKCKIIEKY